jgi:hypothetical protein
MQSFKNTTGLIKEYISRDHTKPLFRETVITRLFAVQATGHPAITPVPSFAGGLTNIMANWEDGLCRVDYTFQSLPISGSQIAAAVEDTYDLQSALTEEPITSHKKIASLRRSYAEGFKDGKVLWYQTLQSGGTNGTDRDGNAVSNLNPFANVDSYLEATATYTISKTFPYRGVDLSLSRIGKIASSTPFGALPSTGTDQRNWLYAGATMAQRGSSYTYSIKYLLSGPGGWNSEIYS